MIAIQPAAAEDVPALDALLRTTFAAPDEANLVRDLCVEGSMVLVFVAREEDSGALVGMVAFSRMEVRVGVKDVQAVALAPVAVLPEYRQQGVAEALIRGGLERLEAAGVVLCFVLGDPAFYGRFGFDADIASGFESRYAGEHFMALPLQGGLIPCGDRDIAHHAPAFARLGTAA